MNLIPRFIYGELDLTDAPYGIEFGSDFGNPENVVEVVQTLLRDGEVLEADRRTNRTLTLTVLVESADLLALAQAEAALIAECDRQRNTLTIDPGDGIAPATVFDTFRSQPRWVRNDTMESQGFRRYTLTIPTLPHGRSTTLTTEVAEGIPSVGTTVNAADSLTGWSTPTAVVPGATFGSYVAASPQPSSMIAVDTTTKVEGAGSVAAKAWKAIGNRVEQVLPTGDGTQVDTSLTLTQAINITAGSYLSFAVKLDNTVGKIVNSQYGNYQEYGTLDTFTITTATTSRTYYNAKTSYASTSPLLRDAIIEALPNGWTRYTFQIGTAMSVTSLTWTSEHVVPYVDDLADVERPRILIDQVAIAASATLGNQVLKNIDVGGSARTTGSIHVAAPSDSVTLGPTLIFTAPKRLVADGWRPDIKQFVQSGASTGTVGGRTGVYTAVNSAYGGGGPVFTVPASSLQSGAYTLAMLGYWNSPLSPITVEASLMMGTTVVSTQELDVTLTTSLLTWQFQVLGTMYLPPTMVQLPSTSATVRFRIKSTGNAPIGVDNIYLLPVEGDLSIVDCGTGTVGPAASSHLWIDSPSPDQPQGGYWRGATPNRSDALSAWSTTVVPGTHTFEAGPMLAFAVSDAAGPTVSFEYFKSWFANAAS